MCGIDGEVQRLVPIARQVRLNVGQQPLDAAVGPVGQGAALGGQWHQPVPDDQMGGVAQNALGKGNADRHRFRGPVKAGEFFKV